MPVPMTPAPARLTGPLLQGAMIAASRSVLQLQEHLNAINVFPVADGDTGTNLALTLRSAVERALACHDVSVSDMSGALAEGALLGAHGCSGAILAQFLYGLSVGLSGQSEADVASFARAASKGAAFAREAVAEPRDGTMLTVMRDWAAFIDRHGSQASDLRALLAQSLPTAVSSLGRTPEQLTVLADAGVVDAGAQGFVAMLEGMRRFLESGAVDPEELKQSADGLIETHRVASAPVRFRFCTQAAVSGHSVNQDELRKRLETVGDSVIVAGTNHRLHVHLHTDDPQQAFAIVRDYGELDAPRFEDMRAQHMSTFEPRAVALITDSACDLPADEVIRGRIRMVPLKVVFGASSFLDKVTITDKEFYRQLATSLCHPTTSHPTAEQFREAYLRRVPHQRAALAITVSAALSGTFQAAKTAAHSVRDQIDVSVIDSKSVSAGLGLILREAADAVESGSTLEDVHQRVTWAVQNVRVFATVETVEYLVRGGRLSGARGRLARALKIRPILTLDEEGKVRVEATAYTARQARRRLMELVRKTVVSAGPLRCIVAHADAPKTASEYGEALREFLDIRDLSIVPLSAVFGAHAGPGAVTVAFLGAR